MPPVAAVKFSDPLAVMLCFSFRPAAADKDTLAPDNARAVASVPPLTRLRSALPVLMALAGRVRLPPATRLTD